jgi:hypothetical protein
MGWDNARMKSLVMSPCQPVYEMLLAMDRNELCWSLPAIRDLEAIATGKALEWVCAFIESQMHEAGDAERTKRTAWIAELREMRSSGLTADELGHKSRAVWYDGGTRDAIQTSISRLYEAAASLAGGNHWGYCRAVAMAIGVAVDGFDGKRSISTLECLVDSFLDQRQSTPHERNGLDAVS